MAGILFVFASDTGDLATATEVYKVRELAGELEISRHIPAGGDVLLQPPVEFAATLRSANAMVVADPALGFVLDVADDPDVAADPKRIEHIEAVTAGPAAGVKLHDAAKSLTLLPATAVDLDAALVLLGY